MRIRKKEIQCEASTVAYKLYERNVFAHRTQQTKNHPKESILRFSFFNFVVKVSGLVNAQVLCTQWRWRCCCFVILDGCQWRRKLFRNTSFPFSYAILLIWCNYTWALRSHSTSQRKLYASFNRMPESARRHILSYFNTCEDETYKILFAFENFDAKVVRRRKTFWRWLLVRVRANNQTQRIKTQYIFPSSHYLSRTLHSHAYLLATLNEIQQLILKYLPFCINLAVRVCTRVVYVSI